jgi:hypothetical protein
MSNKPVGTNQELATTCPTCRQRILTAYGTHNELECSMNKFQNFIDKEKLRWVPMSDDIVDLLATKHSLPIHQFTHKTNNGSFAGVFVAPWLLEGINTYNSMQMGGMTLAEFLSIMVDDPAAQ